MDNQDKKNDLKQAKHASNQSRKRKKLMLTLLICVLIVLVAGFGYYELYGKFYESTDDAYVQGNLISVSPKIGGTVTNVYVEDGDYVKQGQTLVTLDPNSTQIALDSAKANLASVVRQTRGLYNDVDNYQAQVNIKEVDYSQALSDYKRRQELSKKGVISVEEVTHYRDALASAKNALISAKQALKTKLALTDGVSVANHPAIKSAIATLQHAYLDHLYTTIQSPVSGYIAKRSVQVGEQVSTASALLVVVPLNQVWVNANFKESQLGDMRIGQRVDLTSDLYGDDVHYQGHIASLGIGTGSAFALLPAQNATGNWIKIVQRLPVRIALERNNLTQHPLRIGLSMNVTVHLRDKQGSLLNTAQITKPRFTTDIYDHQLQMAHKLATKILIANGIDAKQAAMTVNDEARHDK